MGGARGGLSPPSAAGRSPIPSSLRSQQQPGQVDPSQHPGHQAHRNLEGAQQPLGQEVAAQEQHGAGRHGGQDRDSRRARQAPRDLRGDEGHEADRAGRRHGYGGQEDAHAHGEGARTADRDAHSGGGFLAQL